MKNNKMSKSWNIKFDNAAIHFDFTEDIDIRAAFEAMKATSNEESWLDKLNGIDTDNDTFEMNCEMYGGVFSDTLPAIVKAVAEIFHIPFEGNAWYSELECYCEYETTFSFNGKQFTLTAICDDDDSGYFCPDCGYHIAASGEFEHLFGSDEVEEFECDCCGETIKIADLKYIPPIVTKVEYTI